MPVWCLAYRRTQTGTQMLTMHTGAHTHTSPVFFSLSLTRTHACTRWPLPVWCCFQPKTKPCVGAILCWPKLDALLVQGPSVWKGLDSLSLSAPCLSLCVLSDSKRATVFFARRRSPFAYFCPHLLACAVLHCPFLRLSARCLTLP